MTLRFLVSLVMIAFSSAGLFAQQEPDSPTASAEPTAKVVGWPMERGNATSTGSFADSVGDKFEIEWEFTYPKGAFESSPIVVAGDGKPTVFVAGIDVNVKGKIYSIDLESGKANWEYEIEEGFIASPAWHDGKLFVADMSGVIYCVDAKSGDEVWKFETETQAQISSSGNFYKSLVLFGSEDATLYAIDRESGKLKWSHSIEDQIQCGATVAGDRCFLAGCDAKLHIIGLEDGKEIDAIEIGSPTGTTAAAIGDNVFFGTEQGTFFSINYRDPKVNWKWELPGVSIRSSAAVTNSHIVFGARNRKVSCLDPETGDLKWAAKVKAKVDGSPIIAGNRVYVGSTDGRLYVLDLEDGRELWQKQFNGAILGSPAIIGGTRARLVVATERGKVYCLKASP